MARKKKTAEEPVKTAKALFEDPYGVTPVAKEDMAIKKDNFYDIMKALFWDKDYINNITNEFMTQSFFMVRRTLAIRYPALAQLFNKTTVNAPDVIKYLAEFLPTQAVQGTSWIYTSIKKSQAETEKITPSFTPSDKLIASFAVKKGCSIKDVQSALKLFPEETNNELQEFETQNKPVSEK